MMTPSAINIISFNCRSIYSKLSEIKVYIYATKPHCVCFTETWLIPNKLPSFINYRSFWKPRTHARGGGLGILIRSDVPVLPSQLQDIPDSPIEVQKVTVSLSNTSLDILNIYNPSGTTSYPIFSNYFSQIGSSAIIVGDFNAHHPLWSLPQKIPNTAGHAIAQILQTNNNICLATQPGFITYIHPATGTASVLDLCFVTANLLTDISISRGPCMASDHYPIIVHLKNYTNTCQIRFRKRYKLNNIDWKLWQTGLSNITWNPSQSLDEANKIFTEKLKSSDYHIPETSGNYKPKYHKPWWSPQCNQLVLQRRQAKRIFCKHPTEHNLRLLRIAENKTKQAISEAKKHSWQSYTSTLNSSTPTGQIWNKIKSLRNTYKPSVIVLEHGGNLYTENQDKAEIFADHFQEKFAHQRYQTTHNNLTLLVQSAIIKEDHHHYNNSFTEEELQQALQSLRNTSPGQDRIENLFLKHLPSQYFNYLLSLYNHSFNLETLASSWKEALLMPILKPGKNSLHRTSYRPISMLSCIGKTMERLINNRLDWTLERSLLLNHVQSGFRKKRSTYDQLTCLENTIRKALYDKTHCIVIFLDLEGAFDAVDHTSVLFKLSKLGIEGRMLGWLQSFLSNRCFRVSMGGVESSSRPIQSGVPQGSILSPILFNVLLHDIPQVASISISLFADDIAIYSTGDDIPNLLNALQNYLNQISSWLTQWYQKLNPSKSKIMFFSQSTQLPPPLYLHNTALEYVQQYKFLGLQFDSPKLTWSYHIQYLKQRTTADISLLKSISHNHWGSDRKTLLMFYKSLIRSKLDYASHLYNSATHKLISPLETIQNQCLRICTGLRNTTPIISLLAESHIPSLKYRRTLLGLNYYGRIMEQPVSSPVVKHLKNTCPSPYPGYFQTTQHTLNQWKVSPPAPNHCLARSPFPPWFNPATYISDDFINSNVQNITPLLAHQLFSDLTQNRYPLSCHIFTDGSKSHSQTASAYVIPMLQIKEFYPLPEQCSVLTTELYAIYRAVKFAYANPQNRPYVLFTDSLSAVHLLQNNNPSTYRWFIYNIQSIIFYMENALSIQWIPGHKGISGNDAADTHAKSNHSLPIVLMPVPYEDYIRNTLSRFYDKWKETWMKEILDTGKGTALFTVKTDLKYWPWAENTIRAVETGIARLRVGHVGLAQYMFRFGMTMSPVCSCGELETISHFLLHCPNYIQQRNQLSQSLNQSNITAPLSIQLLLGGSSLAHKHQKQIVHALSVYLHSTNKLASL